MMSGITCGRITNTLITGKPNWEIISNTQNQEYNQNERLVNDYDLVKDNLIFMSWYQEL